MPQLTIQQAFNLGLQHHQTGRLQEAEQLYRQIMAVAPQHAGAVHFLGVLAHQTGHLEDAVDLIQRSIGLDSSVPSYSINLGNLFQDMGRLDDAIAAYRTALRLQPNFAEAHNNLGNALKSRGQWEESIMSFRAAIRLKPDFADAHINLGVALVNIGRVEEAIAAYRTALRFQPDSSDAHCNLGNALKNMGQLDDAIASYRMALRLRPDFAEVHSNLVYLLHFHPAYTAQAIAEEHRQWNRQHAEPLAQGIEPHRNDRSPDRKLRIAYVSPDFCDHVVGRNLLPLFAHHDRQQFEIFAYAQVPAPDALTKRFRELTDHWRNIMGRTDTQVAAQIREDGIDILIDTTLHMAHNRMRVFARKPAPVQVTFAGYPGSTGLTAIDYRLSDPYLDEPGMDESIYSEQTIRLPESFWCYDPLDGRELPLQPLPALQNGFITFGCLNNFCKVNEPLVELWVDVLQAVEGSRLLLLSPEGRHRERTLDALTRKGVAAERVEFVPFQPRRNYLELFHRIDVGLDSFPYNGHTTSLDSFWMGVPVVTLVGKTAVARAGWCQLCNLGLPELAGNSPAEFVNIATELAHNLPRLTELRATLRERMQASPLMDAPRFARNIESAYRQMWQRWSRGPG